LDREGVIFPDKLREKFYLVFVQISYNSSGKPSGSAKKVKRLPVNSSTRIGSVCTFFADKNSMASSRSFTSKVKLLEPEHF